MKKSAFTVWDNWDLQHNIFSQAIFLSTRSGSMKMNGKYIPQHRTALWIANLHTRNIFWITGGQFSTTSGRCFSWWQPVPLWYLWEYIGPQMDSFTREFSYCTICWEAISDWILVDCYEWRHSFFLESDEHWWWINLHKHLEVHQMRFAGCQCYWQDILRSPRWMINLQRISIILRHHLKIDCSSVAVFQCS